MQLRELLKFLGLKIRTIRKEKGLSQERLAEMANLHPTYISNIEQGKVNASLYSYYMIARALKVTLGELVDLPKDDTKRKIAVEVAGFLETLKKLDNKKRTLLMNTMKELISCMEK
jgi:transcriptional regulator with XRE-family HTH domain